MRFLAVLAPLLLTLLTASATASNGPDLSGIVAKAQQSLAIVGEQNSDGSFAEWGTAFCYSSNGSSSEFLTAYHVVANATPANLVLFLPNHPRYQAHIVRLLEPMDVVTVSADVGNIPALTIASTQVNPLTEVGIGGFSATEGALGGLTAPAKGDLSDLGVGWIDGHVTRYHYNGSMMELDANLDKGVSGAAVLSPQGEVLGVFVGYRQGASVDPNRDPAVTASYTRWAVTSAVLRQLIQGQAAQAAGTVPGIVTASATGTIFDANAARGDAAALNTVGLMYSDGSNGHQLNATKALQSFKAAAAQRDTDAQNNLGLAYLDGRGVAQDLAQARRYFEEAAEAGNADAQSNLGYLYLYGRGVAADAAKAFQYFSRSAAAGNAKGEANLGVMYANGIGVARNDARALEYFQRSAAQGDPYGESNLGWMYDEHRQSQAIAPNPQEALRLYQAAARQASNAIFYLPGANPQGIEVTQRIHVGKLPERAVITPDGREVYVTNAGSNTVSVIDTLTDTVTNELPVGRHPVPIAISRNGRHVYVGNNEGTINVIDTSTKDVDMIPTSFKVQDVAVAPDEKRLFVAGLYDGLFVVDLATRDIERIDATPCPEGLAMTPDGKTLYVNYQCGGPGGRMGHDAVAVYHLDPNEPCSQDGGTTGCRFAGIIQGLPNVGGGLTLSPDGTQLWVNGNDACSQPVYDHIGCPVVPGSVINVIETARNRVAKTIVFQPNEGNGDMSFFPNGDVVLIGGGDVLKIVDWKHGGFRQPLSLPDAGQAAFSRDGKRAFLPVGGNDEVDVVTVI